MVLRGITEESSYDNSRLYTAVKPLPDITWAVTQLTTEQQSYLDNIYMGWLSGLDPFGDTAILIKGVYVCLYICVYACAHGNMCAYMWCVHMRMHEYVYVLF